MQDLLLSNYERSGRIALPVIKEGYNEQSVSVENVLAMELRTIMSPGIPTMF